MKSVIHIVLLTILAQATNAVASPEATPTINANNPIAPDAVIHDLAPNKILTARQTLESDTPPKSKNGPANGPCQKCADACAEKWGLHKKPPPIELCNCLSNCEKTLKRCFIIYGGC